MRATCGESASGCAIIPAGGHCASPFAIHGLPSCSLAAWAKKSSSASTDVFYKSLCHNDSDAMPVLDRLQIVECNQQVEALFGCPRSAILFHYTWRVAPDLPFGACLTETLSHQHIGQVFAVSRDPSASAGYTGISLLRSHPESGGHTLRQSHPAHRTEHRCAKKSRSRTEKTALIPDDACESLGKGMSIGNDDLDERSDRELG